MYTRFKSQKSGIKLGLNTITNPSRARVVIPPPNAPVQPTGKMAPRKSDEITSATSKSESLNSSSSTSLSSIPSAVVSASPIVASTASVIVTSDQELPANSTSEALPVKGVFSAPKSAAHKKDSNRNKASEDSSYEEIVDPTTISYVKSLWEKYTSELGTQNGPLRHVDPATEHPHLNGFVALDMEHWWADRFISSMINEKSLNTPPLAASPPSSLSSPSSSKHATASAGLLTPSTSSSSASSTSASSISSPTQLASPSSPLDDSPRADASTTGSRAAFEMNDLMLMNAFTGTSSSSTKSLKFTNTTTSTSTSKAASAVLNSAKFSSSLSNVQMCFS